MSRSIRFTAAACAALALATAAVADEQQVRARPDAPEIPAAMKQREVAPLLYALPPLGTKEAAKIEIRVHQVKHQLVREVVALPADVPAGAAIDVLFTHPKELQRLRTIEAQTPGSLRFIALVGERVVTDEPFAAIEARGAALSLDAAIGEIREVEVRGTPKALVRANTIIKDPACMEWCDQQLAQCLDWCDPRGSDCNLCYTWYHDCSVPCPDVCYEPKSVSNWSSTTLVSATPFGTGCYGYSSFGERWTHYATRYHVTNYQRTEHCDGSYTDSVVSSYDVDTDCWSNTHQSCSPKQGVPPANQC